VFAGVTKGDVAYDEDLRVARERQYWQDLQKGAATGDVAVLLRDDVQKLTREWEQSRGTPAAWKVIAPEEITSEGGATIQRLEDGALLSTGACPEKETITVTATSPLQRITAVRLELLTDPTLPQQGPGRQDNGNLHLSEFELHVTDGAGTRKLPFSRATADFDQQGLPVTHAIDGQEKTDWGIHPRVGEPHVAVFELAEPLTASAGMQLRFVLKQNYGGRHIVGKFRVSLTGDPADQARPLPAALETALLIAPPDRGEIQQLMIARHVAVIRSAEELANLPPPVLV
jgi:hypothetical protein